MFEEVSWYTMDRGVGVNCGFDGENGWVYRDDAVWAVELTSLYIFISWMNIVFSYVRMCMCVCMYASKYQLMFLLNFFYIKIKLWAWSA